MSAKQTLLIIDIQNDFCPGGALEVEEGDKIVPLVNSLMARFPLIAATQDWHPPDQISFASQHSGKNPFDTIQIEDYEQILWPEHCVAGTRGAEFHNDLDTDKFNLILRKGTDSKIDSYSAFKENDGKTLTGLAGYLSALKIEEVFLCGLATNVCVMFSALDAVDSGFKTSIISDACRGIDTPAGAVDASIEQMKKKGVHIIKSQDIL